MPYIQFIVLFCHCCCSCGETDNISFYLLLRTINVPPCCAPKYAILFAIIYYKCCVPLSLIYDGAKPGQVMPFSKKCIAYSSFSLLSLPSGRHLPHLNCTYWHCVGLNFAFNEGKARQGKAGQGKATQARTRARTLTRPGLHQQGCHALQFCTKWFHLYNNQLPLPREGEAERGGIAAQCADNCSISHVTNILRSP